jgi:hypothetical protein
MKLEPPPGASQGPMLANSSLVIRSGLASISFL